MYSNNMNFVTEDYLQSLKTKNMIYKIGSFLAIIFIIFIGMYISVTNDGKKI